VTPTAVLHQLSDISGTWPKTSETSNGLTASLKTPQDNAGMAFEDAKRARKEQEEWQIVVIVVVSRVVAN
jgi:hypothetical protein